MILPAEKVETSPRLGVFNDLTNEEYHRGGGISKSGLDDIAQSPLHYITKRRHPRPSTPAMVIGSAAHKIILEPDTFGDEFIAEPVNAPRRPTAAQLNAKKASPAALLSIAFWEKWDEENGGKIMLSTKPGDDPFWQPSDWDRVHRMRDAVADHSIASVLLDPDQGKAELSVFWMDRAYKKLCKCRPDFINEAHNLAVDLKTTENASYTESGKSCAKWRYHGQDPWYRDGLMEAGRPVNGFVFVFVEKSPPYGVGVYIITEEARHVGREQNRRLLETYAECHAKDEWPGYPTDIRDLELPRWGLTGNIS